MSCTAPVSAMPGSSFRPTHRNPSRTAKTHVKRILAKMDARDREAVVFAYRSGLIDGRELVPRVTRQGLANRQLVVRTVTLASPLQARVAFATA